MKVLVVAAHSDEKGPGCGGTSAQQGQADDGVDLLLLADGEGFRDLESDHTVGIGVAIT